MKCPTCGFENRPDARFCKQCGQPIQVQAAPASPPMPPGTICPACGATAKPGARFCPRCGKPLPAVPAQPSTPPPAPAQMPVTQPAMPAGIAPQPGYAAPPPVPPPSTPQAARRGLPGWVWWAGGVLVFICIVAVVVVAVVFGPQLIGRGGEPAAPPPPTETPGVVEAAPTPTPIVETTPTETLATEAPTATPQTETPVTEAPTEVPLPPASGVEIGIAVSADQLQVNDPLAVTVTVVNGGEATVSNLRYRLVGDWTPYLEVVEGAGEVRNAKVLLPGEADTATFVLRAALEGRATIQAYVLMDVHTDPPAVGSLLSEIRTVSVTSQ